MVCIFYIRFYKDASSMENNLHPNFLKASNLMFGNVALGVVNMLLIPHTFTSGVKTVLAVVALLFYASISYAIRKGKNWTRFLLLFLMVFGLLVMPFIIDSLKSNILLGLIKVIQTLLQFCALILLFKVPKQGAIKLEN
jgi:hypothetical protein